MHEFSLHPFVQKELDQILTHYTNAGGTQLADKFFAEVEQIINQIQQSPNHFHCVDEVHRRANLKKFPYHFIFEITLKGTRITVLRHHKRNPRYGMRRK